MLALAIVIRITADLFRVTHSSESRRALDHVFIVDQYQYVHQCRSTSLKVVSVTDSSLRLDHRAILGWCCGKALSGFSTLHCPLLLTQSTLDHSAAYAAEQSFLKSETSKESVRVGHHLVRVKVYVA